MALSLLAGLPTVSTVSVVPAAAVGIAAAAYVQPAHASCEWDGVAGERVYTTSGAPVTTRPITVVAWVKPLDTAATKVVVDINVSGGNDYYQLRLTSTEVPQVATRHSTNGSVFATAASAASTSAWNFVHSINAAADSRFAGIEAVNGTEGTDTSTPNGTVNQFWIGLRGGGDPFAGWIAAVGASNQELSEAQLATVRATDPQDWDTLSLGFVGMWDMRAGCTTTVTDDIGSLDLTVSNVVFDADNPTIPTVPSWSSGPTFTPVSGGIQLTGAVANGTEAGLCLLLPAAGDPDPEDCEDGSASGAINESSPDTSPAAVDVTATMDYIRAKPCAWAKNGSGVYATISCGSATNRTAADTIRVLTSIDATSPFAAKSDAGGVVDHDGANPNRIGGLSIDFTEFVLVGHRVSASGSVFDCAKCIVIGKDEDAGEYVDVEEDGIDSGDPLDVDLEYPFPITIEIGDVFEHDAETSLMLPVDSDVDGTFEFGTVMEPLDDSCHTLGYRVQDVSATSLPAWIVDDGLFHVGCGAPIIENTPDPFTTGVLLYVGVPFSVQLVGSDPNDLALTWSARDAEPSATSLSSSGEFSGTPDVEDESGWTFRVDLVNSGYLYAVPRSVFGWTTNDEIEAPNCVGGDLEACDALMQGARPWLVGQTQTSVSKVCDLSTTDGEILSQTPAAMGTLAAENDLLGVTVNTHSLCRLIEQRRHQRSRILPSSVRRRRRQHIRRVA